MALRTPEEIFAQGVPQGSSAPITNPNLEEMRAPLAAKHQAQAAELRSGTLNDESARRLARILKERKDTMDPEQFKRGMATLRAYAQENPEFMTPPQPTQADDRILRDPVPTGDPTIDRAGTTRTIPGSALNPAMEQRFPSLEDLPADDPRRVKAQYASEGVDLTGANIGFFERANLAAAPNIVRARSERIASTLAPRIAALPEDLRADAVRYDEVLGDYLMLLPDKEQPGKYRWSSLEGSGLELADLADVLNPAEILSMAGGVAGAGKKRVFKTALGPRKSMALNGLLGGLSGRVAGELISIVDGYMRTGFVPTTEELTDLGLSSAQIELFATATGELGAAILRQSSTLAQEAVAKAQGKQGVIADRDTIRIHNQNIFQTRSDMRRVEKVLGKEGQLPITEGGATRSIDLIEDEIHKRANASRSTQRKYNKAQAQERRTTVDFIEAGFGGNRHFLGDMEGAVQRANRSVVDAATVVAQTENGIVHFAPKVQPEFGLKVKPDGSTTHWSITGAKMRDEELGDLSGVGLGKKLYLSALYEANAHGKGLQSGPTVRGPAALVWDSFRRDGISVKRNPKATYDEATDQWSVPIDEPEQWVYRTEQPTKISEELLPDLKKTTFVPTAKGRVRAVEGEGLSEFIRGSSPATRRIVEQEIAENPFVRQQWKEAVLEDYERTVLKGDKVDAKAFAKWKKETASFRDMLFDSPEEFFKSGEFGKLRNVVMESREVAERHIELLQKTFPADEADKINFKDPSQREMWAQFRGMDPRMRRRAMRVLDHVGLGTQFRAVAREELKNSLHTMSKGTNVTGLNKWIDKNEKIIRDIYGAQRGSEMLSNLKVLRNILQRRSDRLAIKGLSADANPTALALTRVVFGPLSRAQRFFSAARRGQVRAGAADIGDIITDPDLLKELKQIQLFDVSSRRVQRWMQDANVLDQFWWSGEAYDADNEEHRRQVAQNVKTMYLEEANRSGTAVE